MWYNFLIPHIAKNSLKVFTVSESSKRDIVKYLAIPAEKIEVVYNASSLGAGADATFALPDEPYLLTISSQDPRKNLGRLLKAHSQIKENVKLVVVGLKSELFATAFSDDDVSANVEIKGYVTDAELVYLLRHATAFVYVSLYEGFGLPPLEAMVAECPVIVSAIEAHKEVCGDAALYADPLDVADISLKISELLTNAALRERLVAAGSQNAKRFSWEASAIKVLNVINGLV